jgi:hypothetical protein
LLLSNAFEKQNNAICSKNSIADVDEAVSEALKNDFKQLSMFEKNRALPLLSSLMIILLDLSKQFNGNAILFKTLVTSFSMLMIASFSFVTRHCAVN